MKSSTEKCINVVHLNKMAFGGAFISAFRLYQAQIEHSFRSRFIVEGEIEPNPLIESLDAKNPSILDKLLNKLKIKEIPALKQHRINQELANKYEMFRFYWGGNDLHKHKRIQSADIVHLHWVVGLIDFEFIRSIKKPVVWTLHDMNAFTGGCHYSQGCEGFLSDCNHCPGLNNKYPANELSKKVRALKKSPNLNLTIVSPSQWLYKAASASNLFQGYRNEYIPYGLNEHDFYIHDKSAARKEFRLPLDKKIILFCSGYETYRKGFDLLLNFYTEYQRNNQDILLVCVGPTSHSGTEANVLSLGYLKDNLSLSKAYSAADLLVVSSREDNLPNTVLEGLFCGCPVVGFNIGGMPDMISDGINGYLAKEITSESLGQAIKVALNDDMLDSVNIRANALKKFSLHRQLDSYKALYHSIMIAQ